MSEKNVSIELDCKTAFELLNFLKCELDESLSAYAEGVRKDDVLLQSLANESIDRLSKVVFAIELSLGIRKH